MKKEEEKDEQLIRWLAGELTGQELSTFEERAEFNDYKKIVDGVDDLTYPEMDEKAVFSQIQKRISTKPSIKNKGTKVIPMKRWILAIASVAVLALAFLFLLPGSVNVASGVGQFVSHTLPDGSEIELNGNSELEYKNDFANNRVLHLTGEAFFKVKKGESFKVNTDEGIVSVLGTSFNVFVRDEILVVSCKTGKVQVDASNQSLVLEPGDKVRIEKNQSRGKESMDPEKIGTWVDGESYFSGASLEEVILSLSSVYNTEINLPEIYHSERFTGSFVHNDFKKALKMVFSPMEISYSLDDRGKVVFND